MDKKVRTTVLKTAGIIVLLIVGLVIGWTARQGFDFLFF